MFPQHSTSTTRSSGADEVSWYFGAMMTSAEHDGVAAPSVNSANDSVSEDIEFPDYDAHKKAESGEVHSPLDTIANLKAEGVCEPIASPEDTSVKTTPRTSRLQFSTRVTIREYVKGSVPDSQFKKKASQPSSSSGGSAPSSDDSLVESEASTTPVELSWLEDCSAELDVLESTLPVKSNDPACIEYTRDIILAARHAISESRVPVGAYRDCLRLALGLTSRAHGFHEETLRRVNGPTHFELFERTVQRKQMSHRHSWSRHAGRKPSDFYDDVPDEAEKEDKS